MTQLDGASRSISREGIQTVRVRFYVETIGAVDDIPGQCPLAVGGSCELVEIQSTQAEEGSQHIVAATYEGLAAEAFRKTSYAWEPSSSQDPIQTHPDWDNILKTYQGREDPPASGNFTWPDIKAKKGSSTKNPMTGVASYLTLGGTWSEMQAVEEIPSDLWDDMWALVSSVPGDLPTPENRLWLVLPPRLEKRGAAFTITRLWQLTGEMNATQMEAARMIYRPIKT